MDGRTDGRSARRRKDALAAPVDRPCTLPTSSSRNMPGTFFGSIRRMNLCFVRETYFWRPRAAATPFAPDALTPRRALGVPLPSQVGDCSVAPADLARRPRCVSISRSSRRHVA